MKRRKPLIRHTRLKRRSTSPIAKLKARLWFLTRQIIIKKHGNTCYTCGASELKGGNLQGGHFIPSSVCSVELRYSLDNIRPQCYSCNIWKSGNWVAYEAHLRLDGIDVEALKRRNEETKGKMYDRLFYEAKIAEYTELLSTLETSNSLQKE